MTTSRDDQAWTKIGKQMAAGKYMLKQADLIAIACQIDLGDILAELLPSKLTVQGSADEKKHNIFLVAAGLFGLWPHEWLKQEKMWLDIARLESGSTETGGKDKIEDVVAAEIMVRIVATANFVVNHPEFAKVDILALNMLILEAASKGRTRMERVGGNGTPSLYSEMLKYGTTFGAGSKYLPNPALSLPKLLLLLRREKMSPSAYRQ